MFQIVGGGSYYVYGWEELCTHWTSQGAVTYGKNDDSLSRPVLFNGDDDTDAHAVHKLMMKARKDNADWVLKKVRQLGAKDGFARLHELD